MRRRPALTDEASEAVQRRIEMLHRKPRLDLAAVATAVESARDIDGLRQRLGDPIRYSQRVEAEVAGLSIETLLPHATNDYVADFLGVWVPDERGHGDALDLLLTRLELPPEAPRDESTIPIHNRVAGILGRGSRHIYEMVSMIYHSIGAINERLALAAYKAMAGIAAELGEQPLVDVLFTHLQRDESAHLGYYRTYARQLRAHVAPWQLATARLIIVKTYAPVGAGDARDKPLMGAVLTALEDDPENPAIATTVQAVAEELLAADGRSLPPFVLRSLRRCLAESKRAALPAA